MGEGFERLESIVGSYRHAGFRPMFLFELNIPQEQFPGCGGLGASGGVPSGFGFERQTTLDQYGMGQIMGLPDNNLQVVPYHHGMSLDGGVNLYNGSTNSSQNVILDMPDVGLQMHTHPEGVSKLVDRFRQDEFSRW